MKLLLILLPLFFNLTNVNEQHYHQLFINAAASNKGIEEFNNTMKMNKKSDYLSTAYFGVSEMMAASLGWNPYTKLKLFENGKKLLEKVIKEHNENAELRFLRLTVQVKCPEILSYNQNIKEDKTKVINSIASKNFSSDKNFIKVAKQFLIENVNLTESEKKIINGN